MILAAVTTIKPTGACLWLPWVPQDIFFLPISNFEHGLFHIRYFDNGPSQGSLWFHVVKKVRYRDLLNGGMSDPCQLVRNPIIRFLKTQNTVDKGSKSVQSTWPHTVPLKVV